MRLATPAVPQDWQLQRLEDGSARVVITRKCEGWSLFVGLLLFWLLPPFLASGAPRSILLWLIQLGAIGFLLIQLADCLAHRAIGREVWHFTPLGLNIRREVFAITWYQVDFFHGTLTVMSGEGAVWDLHFQNGITTYSLYQSDSLDEVLGLAAFLEEELRWPLQVSRSTPQLFRQVLEHALAKQDRERIRILLQDERQISLLMRAWREWDPIFRPRLRDILLELECEMGCLSKQAGQIGSEAQAGAVELLGELGASHAQPVLRRALEVSAGSVRVQAARALGRLRDREAVPSLCAALQYAPELRETAAVALGEIRDSRATPALLELLHGPGQISDVGCRQAVVVALGQIKDPAAVPVLAAVLQGEAAEVREAVADALGEIGGREAIEPLSCALTDVNGRVALRAAVALGRIRDPAALRALAGARAKSHPEVRIRAVRALVEIGDESAITELCRALCDPSGAVRYEAAAGFSRLAGFGSGVPVQIRSALPILRQMTSPLSVERADLKHTCREAISRIETATVRMKQLPLPAARRSEMAVDLPVPAQIEWETRSIAQDPDEVTALQGRSI